MSTQFCILVTAVSLMACGLMVLNRCLLLSLTALRVARTQKHPQGESVNSEVLFWTFAVVTLVFEISETMEISQAPYRKPPREI